MSDTKSGLATVPERLSIGLGAPEGVALPTAGDAESGPGVGVGTVEYSCRGFPPPGNEVFPRIAGDF